MNLLWITENFPPGRGGMAQSCDRIVTGLRENGFEIHLVHFTNRKKAFQTERLENGTYTAIPVKESEAHTLNLFWNFIKNFPFPLDRMVVFGGYLPVIAGPVISKWLSLSMMTLLRGNDFDTAIFMPRRRESLFQCLRASIAIGCVTMEMMEKIRLLESGLPLFYSPNGINLTDWELLSSERAFAEKWRKENFPEKKCLGIIGQLKDKKGVDLLIDACNGSQLIKERIGLLLIGDMDDQINSMLIDSGIDFCSIPFKDRFELLKYYGACDVIGIPSYYDGMPNVLLEAGALGIPVFGADIGGIYDVLNPDLSSLLFQAGNLESLRSLLLKVASMEECEMQEKGTELRRIIISKYSHDKEIENLTNYLINSKKNEINL